jgi:hypothetical protein
MSCISKEGSVGCEYLHLSLSSIPRKAVQILARLQNERALRSRLTKINIFPLRDRLKMLDGTDSPSRQQNVH